MRSAAAALAWAEGQKTWPHALCMNFVWNAYGAPVVIPPGGYPDANSGWAHTADKHPGDRTPPKGAPVYFSGPDGHICLATGVGDQVYSTDVGGYGINGYSTIAQIERMWGRTYYGWGGDIFGHTIDYNTPTKGKIMRLVTNPAYTPTNRVHQYTVLAEGVAPYPFLGTYAEAVDMITRLGMAPSIKAKNQADYDLIVATYTPATGPAGSAPSAAQNAAAVDLILQPRFAAVPTAAANGSAARTAIVKP